MLLAALAAPAVTIASPATAQGVELQSGVSSRRVEVGEPFAFQLSAMGGDQAPSNPRLRVPAGMSVHGPSVSSNQQVTIVGGHIERTQGITSSWTLVASKPGTYQIGPASVEVAGKTLQGKGVTVVVVPQGQGSRAQRGSRRRGWPFDPLDDPFDLLGRPSRSLGGLLDDLLNHDSDSEPTLPPFPEELRLERAPDQVAFLRTVVQPRRVVVGEQVTLSIFAYGALGPFREANPGEPQRADFIAYPIVENSSGERMFRVPIEERTWFAVKVRELALFPIKPGTLPAGGMKMSFDGRRYRTRPDRPITREGEKVGVIVTEPPLQGRPTGYALGDVGSYELSATVEPRKLTQGDAVSVFVELSGTGNVPLEVRVPQQTDVEWLKPTISSDVSAQSGIVKGTRKFNYVVRIEKSGDVDLGAVTLPFFDPRTRRFSTARAELGKVSVKPNLQRKSAAKHDREAGELGLVPRKKLGPAAGEPSYLDDQRSFWALLFAAPAGMVAVGGTLGLGEALLRRRRRRRGDGEAVSARALDQAEAAVKAGDHAATAAALERALFAAIEAKTGLKARAVLRGDLGAALAHRGVGTELADAVVALLDALEASRFSGVEGENDMRELVENTRRSVRALKRAAKAREG